MTTGIPAVGEVWLEPSGKMLYLVLEREDREVKILILTDHTSNQAWKKGEVARWRVPSLQGDVRVV